jgi:hypothetical protein
MRIALGAGGLAVLSAIVSSIVAPPKPVVVMPAADTGQSASAPGTPITVQRPIQYVQLLPGQTAPPGAKVIDPAAPTPLTVVTTVPAPAQAPKIIRTTQSGKVIP